MCVFVSPTTVQKPVCMCVCRDDRAAEVTTLKAAHERVLLDARTRYMMSETERQQQMTGEDQQQLQQQSGDWLQVEKTVSSAGCVDIAAVSTAEIELKRRVDKLSSMITEVCLCSIIL